MKKPFHLLRGYFVTGTDTGIGKTVVTAGLAANLRQKGINAGIMKPVQTGSKKIDGSLVSVDALFAVKVAGITDEMELVSPYCLEPPLAPRVAAGLAGITIDLLKIKRAYRELCTRHDFMLVEGAGGIMVPIVGRFLMADLIKMLNLPALIVAKPGLGTLNHTLLTVEYAKARGIDVAGIIINGLKDSEAGTAEKTNPGLIAELSGVPVMGIIPHDAGVDVDTCNPGRVIEMVGAAVDWGMIFPNGTGGMAGEYQ